MKTITADDYGLRFAVDKAILKSAKNKTISHVSVLVNLPNLPKSVELIKKFPNTISWGLHLNLCEGRPVSKPAEVNTLLSDSGEFLSTLQLITKLILKKINIEQLECEINAQFSRYKSLGLPLDHINSHQNIHIVPPLTDLILKYALKYKCKNVRQTKTVLKRLKLFPLKYLVINLVIGICSFRYKIKHRKIINSFEEDTCHPGTIYDKWWHFKNQWS